MIKLSEMTGKILIFCCIFIAAVCANSSADVDFDSPSTDTEARGVEILKMLEEKYQETKTIYGEFKQLKVSEWFLEEIHSEGKFWYEKPGRFRCEYLPPNEQVNLVLDDMAYVYIPDIKQVEIYHFKTGAGPVRKLNQMLLGFGVSVKDVLDVYNVNWLPEEQTEDTLALVFRPKSREEGLSFKAIKMWISRSALLPQRLVFLEDTGDRTEIDILEVEFNKKIKDSVFEPDFPDDAEVIEQN